MKLLHAFVETKLWHWIAKNVLAKVTLRCWPHKNPTTKVKDSLFLTIDNADLWDYMLCFVAKDKWALGSILIRIVSRSRWTHAGFIHLGLRIDMRTDGLSIAHINSLFHYDEIALVKIPVNNKRVCESRLSSYLAQKEDLSYDWEQELKDETSDIETNDIYCSELIWLCLKGEAELQTSVVLGRKAFSPEDVYKSGKVIWEYKA